jgi:hypothetical protein
MKLLSDESISPSQLLLYQIEDGETHLEMRMDQETGRRWNWEIKTLRA